MIPLFHRDFGTPGRPPLTLLHGLLGSSRNWQMAGRELQRLGLYDCLRLEGNDGLLELDVQGRFCLIELITV